MFQVMFLMPENEGNMQTRILLPLKLYLRLGGADNKHIMNGISSGSVTDVMEKQK